MNPTSTMQRAAAIGGVTLLAVVGLVGWTRQSETKPAPTANAYATSPDWYAGTARDPEPVSRDRNAPVVYAPSPFGSEAPSAAPAPAARAYDMPAAAAPAPVAQHRRVYRTSARRPRVVVRKRSFHKSAAIVGGSAAGGALIGALAGGGKGAAIGALAGGGGGLVYDRLTFKKRVVR